MREGSDRNVIVAASMNQLVEMFSMHERIGLKQTDGNAAELRMVQVCAWVMLDENLPQRFGPTFGGESALGFFLYESFVAVERWLPGVCALLAACTRLSLRTTQTPACHVRRRQQPCLRK
jgi:hypothetical protein